MQFIVDLKLFPFEVLFSLGETNDKVFKALKKYNIPLDEEHTEKINDSFGKNWAMIFPTGQTIIRLAKVPVEPFDLGVLAHEIFHATCYILDRMGVGFSEESNEVFAYIIQYLTQEALSEIFLTTKNI